MDHYEVTRQGDEVSTPSSDEISDETAVAEIAPGSWRDITEFRDQFDDNAVFGVVEASEDGTEGFWIVRDIEKVRPAAIPIEQPPTFDMNVLNPDGSVAEVLRMTIDEIKHIQATVP